MSNWDCVGWGSGHNAPIVFPQWSWSSRPVAGPAGSHNRRDSAFIFIPRTRPAWGRPGPAASWTPPHRPTTADDSCSCTTKGHFWQRASDSLSDSILPCSFHRRRHPQNFTQKMRMASKPSEMPKPWRTHTGHSLPTAHLHSSLRGGPGSLLVCRRTLHLQSSHRRRF